MEKTKSDKKISATFNSVDFFKNILDKIEIGGLFVDKSRTIRYCNRNIEELFGYSPRKVIGQKTDLLYGDRRENPGSKNEIYRVLERRGFHVGTARGLRKDGKEVELRLSTFINKPKSGAVIFIERIEKAPELTVDKTRFIQNLLDLIPDMIYFKDRENRFVLVNKAHASALNLLPADVIGKSDLDFFPLELAGKYFADDSYVLQTGKPVVGKIEKASRPDGGVTYVSTTKVPHHDDEGRIIGTIGITRNITEQMVAQEELHGYKEHLEDMVEARTKDLEESNERLLRLYNVKSEFASMVSHELRTPLSVIKEGVELVKDGTLGPTTEKQITSLDMVLKNINRLARLINDILDFSKLESKKMKFKMIKGNLNEVISQVLKSYEPAMLKRQNLILKPNLDHALPLVKFDTDRIAQVLHNLINNALKFTEKGYISVESKAGDGGPVRISVKDSGCGVEKENLPRIFERFEQIIPYGEARKGGTGLGLSICKQIVEQLGGRIFVESEYGKGSNFYFTLPTESQTVA